MECRSRPQSLTYDLQLLLQRCMYRKISNIRRTKSITQMLLDSACSCLCATYWSQVLSGEWRCSWSSADRRCSNYIWVINNLIAYKGAAYIRDLTVISWCIDILDRVITAPDWNENHTSWWRHQMETFSALLALCAGNSPVTGEFPSQRPVTRSFDVFFDLRLNKQLSKQSRRRFLRRNRAHYDVTVMWCWWFRTIPCYFYVQRLFRGTRKSFSYELCLLSKYIEVSSNNINPAVENYL